MSSCVACGRELSLGAFCDIRCVNATAEKLRDPVLFDVASLRQEARARVFTEEGDKLRERIKRINADTDPRMDDIDDFTQALRLASLAHPDLRIGEIIYSALFDMCENVKPWHVADESNTDLTDALNKFAKEPK